MVLVASARLSYNNAFYLKCAFLKTKAQQLKQNQQELLWVLASEAHDDGVEFK